MSVTKGIQWPFLAGPHLMTYNATLKHTAHYKQHPFRFSIRDSCVDKHTTRKKKLCWSSTTGNTMEKSYYEILLIWSCMCFTKAPKVFGQISGMIIQTLSWKQSMKAWNSANKSPTYYNLYEASKSRVANNFVYLIMWPSHNFCCTKKGTREVFIHLQNDSIKNLT